MKKKFKDWLRKQVGCPKCDTGAPQPTFVTTTFPTATSTSWPGSMTNGQSVTYTYTVPRA